MTTPASSLPPSPPRDDEEPDKTQRPLDLALIRRLFSYMRPYAARRNWLICVVLLRAAQLPAGAWLIGRVIQGPITGSSFRGTLSGTLGFALLALSTAVVFHYRLNLVANLGEAVIRDLRTEVFAHLQRMTMGFYHRTRLGRVISRMTSDIEAVRVGVQDVLSVSIVHLGQMLIAGGLMLACDPVLFSAVLAIAPIIWGINR